MTMTESRMTQKEPEYGTTWKYCWATVETSSLNLKPGRFNVALLRRHIGACETTIIRRR